MWKFRCFVSVDLVWPNETQIILVFKTMNVQIVTVLIRRDIDSIDNSVCYMQLLTFDIAYEYKM